MLIAMAKRKLAAAVTLGRRGGKKTGRKGLAAMTPEQREAVRAKGLAARLAQKEKAPGS
jgi:hypothetical protein